MSFSIRFPGETIWLYLGRGKGFEGVWRDLKPPESKLRGRDKLLDYVRKQLSSTLFLGLEIDSLDRVAKIKYQKWGKPCCFYYFYRGRDAYFINDFWDETERKIYTSWGAYREVQGNIISLFDEVGRRDVDKKGELKKKEGDIQALLKQEEKSREINQRKKIGKLERKKKNIELDLIKIQGFFNQKELINKWKEILALQGSVKELEQDKLILAGIKFKFSKEMSLFQRLSLIYSKIKKLQPLIAKMKGRLSNVEEDLIKVKDNFVLRKNFIQPIWMIDKSVKKEAKKEEFVEVIFSAGKMAIGKNAQSNDEIRKKWAKKEDWWFHVENVASAHAYVKMDCVPSPDIMKEIAIRLKEGSKFEGSEVPLIYTKVKNLKGVKGKAGAVFFKKEKRIRVYID